MLATAPLTEKITGHTFFVNSFNLLKLIIFRTACSPNFIQHAIKIFFSKHYIDFPSLLTHAYSLVYKWSNELLPDIRSIGQVHLRRTLGHCLCKLRTELFFRRRQPGASLQDGGRGPPPSVAECNGFGADAGAFPPSQHRLPR